MYIAHIFAKIRSSRPAIIVGQNEIDLQFENPNKSDRAWDFDQYAKYNIFIKGYSNPIKLDISDITRNANNFDLIHSRRYITFMKQKVLEEAFFAKGPDFRILKILVIGSILVNVIFGIIIVAIVAG